MREVQFYALQPWTVKLARLSRVSYRHAKARHFISVRSLCCIWFFVAFDRAKREDAERLQEREKALGAGSYNIIHNNHSKQTMRFC